MGMATAILQKIQRQMCSSIRSHILFIYGLMMNVKRESERDLFQTSSSVAGRSLYSFVQITYMA